MVFAEVVRDVQAVVVVVSTVSACCTLPGVTVSQCSYRAVVCSALGN
jgi:hypothetical protein